MDSVMTIEEFSVLMRSEQETSLLHSLRALCAIQEPEKIREMRTDEPEPGPITDAKWGGWDW